MLAALPVSAAGSASLTGPSTVRAGDSITLTFNVNGGNTEGVSGTLSYDSKSLTLSGTKQSISSPWAVEFSGNNMVAYDNDLSKPIKSNTKLFTVTFKVKSGLAAGTNLKVSFTDVRLSDGSNETNAGTVSWSVNLAAPLSGNCDLKSLTVSNATISPAFSASTTSYSASVPFEVSKLNVSAAASDDNAKVTIDSPTLTVNGTTKVTVTVKAQTGATKTYTITVTRAQDPNYVPSGENKLSGITVKDFFISPGFNENVTEYVVWLPFETDKLTVSASTKDRNASYRVEGGNSLTAGADNEIRVICVAENGSEKIYTVIAKRAADPNAETVVPETEPILVTEPEPITEPEETTVIETVNETEEAEPILTEGEESKVPAETKIPESSSPSEKESFPVVAMILIGIACLAVGFVVGKVTSRK